MAKELCSVALTSILSLAAMFFFTKLMGNRQISQLSMFDYVVGITLGSLAGDLALEPETFLNPLLAMAIYGGTAALISIASNHSIRFRRFIAGDPLVLMDGGRFYRENLKKAKLDLGDLTALARSAGYFSFREIETAILEENGRVSFLPKEGNRPLTPKDLELTPKQTRLPLVFIEDGEIICENLTRVKKDIPWLMRGLKAQGYGDVAQVFYFTWEEDALTIYPVKAKDTPPPV